MITESPDCRSHPTESRDAALRATVVITSRGRRDELRRALESCRQQRGVCLEVVVYDDASGDGTDEMVRTEFPEVRLSRNEELRGYIALRNQGFLDATAPLIISIDDDAWMSDPDTVSMILRKTDEFPSAAAFALQFFEPHRTGSEGCMRRIPDGSCVRSYVGCAHAIRRDVASKLGGYRDFLVHQGEERDLCIRLLDAGYEIRYLCSPPIVHQPSANRDRSRMSYYGFRNTLLFSVLNVPFPFVLVRLPVDLFQLFQYKLTVRGIPARCWLLLKAVLGSLRYLPKRAPVSSAAYRHFRSLPGHGPVPVAATAER